MKKLSMMVMKFLWLKIERIRTIIQEKGDMDE